MDPQQNNQVPLQESKKSNHLPIIIILVLLLIGACGFGGYELWLGMQKDTEITELKDKAKGKDLEIAELKEERVTSNINENDNTISISEAESLLKKYLGDTTNYESIKVIPNALSIDPHNASYKLITNFNEDYKFFYAYSMLTSDEIDVDPDCDSEKWFATRCTGKIVGYDVINEKYKSLFGENGSLEKRNYYVDETKGYNYDDAENCYKEYNSRVGYTSGGLILYKIASVERENDNIVISLVFLTLELHYHYNDTPECDICKERTELVEDLSNNIDIYELTLSPYNDTYVLTDVTKM